MEVIIIGSKAYKKLQEEQLQRFKEVLIKANKEALLQLSMESDWIRTEEAKNLLGVKSKSKMQQLRDYGEIEFTQPGKIILYSKKSIVDYLNRHRVEGYYY
tara:strand:- start:804 stop:1106 length:303 start_codon:yes stop_codon:yes gene_type:complete